jgi:hypothetical protein
MLVQLFVIDQERVLKFERHSNISGVGASRPVATAQNITNSNVTPEGSRPAATKVN